jgi:DNA-binding NarL/FixJ family response regulator
LKILACDDHALFRDGLRLVVEALGREVQLLEAATAAEALGIAGAHADLDLALLDLGLPDANGLGLLRTLRERHPTLPVAVVSASEDAGAMRGALDAGAAGFIPKSSSRDVLVRALELILAGGVYVPSEALAAAAQPDFALSERQREVLELMTRGLTNRDIAGVLGISAATVKVHVAAILVALGASNRTEAVMMWYERSRAGTGGR